MKKLLAFVLIYVMHQSELIAQGCVAIRSTGAVCTKQDRRPGYILSVEPGVSYAFRKLVAFATIPVAIEHNRTQSNADKLRTAATGIYAHGDAAFADYVVNIGCSFRF